MGGGDKRPRESRSSEYEPREPDGQQLPTAGDTSSEGDTIQQEISAYTREGNPSEEGPVPEFAGEEPAGDRGDSEGDPEDPLGEFGDPDVAGEGESVGDDESDDDGGEETDGEPSQERVRRMATMTAMWGGTRVVSDAGEEIGTRTERMADEVAERAEEVTADGDEPAE
ncbi:hypothetical protein ACFQDD_02575 [Halorubrum pallidum]|uniref:Uncharacterized protein n=1 Tax=Halorubrum pallidum TaxID=1526114 RepID=A0ABD5SZB1_9EURY